MSCVVGSKIYHWDAVEECTDRANDGGTSMRILQHFLASGVALIVVCTTSAYAPSLAEEPTLITVGPRIGFSGKTPLLGRQQKYDFELFDVAAVFRLPWQSSLGDSGWKLETRLITSAGALIGGGDTGLMATLVPDLALSGWKGIVSIDVGVGAGFFPKYKFGAQNFGGPVQIVATTGITFNPFAHAYAGFRLQHFSDARVYGPSALGVDMYLVEFGYKF